MRRIFPSSTVARIWQASGQSRVQAVRTVWIIGPRLSRSQRPVFVYGLEVAMSEVVVEVPHRVGDLMDQAGDCALAARHLPRLGRPRVRDGEDALAAVD